MSKRHPNNVERLLVYPGSDCACCAGRFGFERGLRSLSEVRPGRTGKEIMGLNPLFIRQLPSFRHQEVHVENMMKAMGSELPKLFKKWRKHLQTYPEMPYLLHFIFATASDRALQLPADILAACKKASPYKFASVERYQPAGFELKKRWKDPVILLEVSRSFGNVLHMPVDNYPAQHAYLPQAMATLADQLKALERLSRSKTELAPLSEGASFEEDAQSRNAARYPTTVVDAAYRVLAEIIIPPIIHAAANDSDFDADKNVRSILADFFAAGGSYERCITNIAELVLEIDPELLIFLDEHRIKLNRMSVSVLDKNLQEVRRTVEERRIEAAARRERDRSERLQRLEAESAREQEHQRLEAERAERRAAKHAARSEPLPDVIQRVSVDDPVVRMMAVACQDGFAPSSFPSEWAAEFTSAHIAELDSTTLKLLIEKTRGVQRGEWKKLHERLAAFDASGAD